MARGGRIWITRAQPGADATATRLHALGHEPLVASLLEVRLLPRPAEPPDGFAALAFTSANAVRAFAGWTPRRDWPVFAVGATTAQAARDAEFREISSANGDVDALGRHIAATSPSGLVLHPCARDAAGDLAGTLSAVGVRVEGLPIYETGAVEHLPAAVLAALQQGDLAAILLHSPKAALALAGLWAGAGRPSLAGVRLLGLSAACLGPVAHLPSAAMHASAQPNEAAMLERL